MSCRVGNGCNVNIVKDLWLPDLTNPYVYTVNETIMNKNVSNLMLVGQNQWDVDLIIDVFIERDASLIMGIPLASNSEDDTWYWRKEWLGQYSVKSAYHLLQEGKEETVTVNYSNYWKNLWKLKVPQRLRIFYGEHL